MNKQAFVFLLVVSFFLAPGCKKDDNPDKSKPFIVLKGANPLTWNQGDSPYTDPGAEAWDINENNDTISITDRLTVTGNVDVNTAGDYNLKFNVSDAAGNSADEKTRLVEVRLTK
ncbi:MAG: DUF5011 domain-containing protein [Bacteroidales bacterium]|nr:DUF5011 domain-containing protein [Bacteroidales bacterium]MCF6341938.1 DUF5011 domain-containing protein [Bacteroidales bacterium]